MSSFPVKLYVYDLSNGMARQMSRQLTGRQIDGIWHTSVVVFGREIFYGQGVSETLPGRSHHGAPLQVIDMGQTSIDEGTFREYLDELKDFYTADKYHLLDFNCNSFTNDCIGFLTGGSIPAFIKDLPVDFLSTPFGAALRPTIDSMYRSPGAGVSVPQRSIPSSNPQSATSILNGVARNAQQPQSSTPGQSLTSPIHVTTNPASFNSLLKSNRAVVAFFTDPTCGPCKMVEPTFKRLATEKSVSAFNPKGAAFAEIDMKIAFMIASEYRITVSPTFLFFMDGKKIHEMKGVDPQELQTQIDLLLFQTYPPHPHKALSLPAVRKLSLAPILVTSVPPLPTVITKLLASIEATSIQSTNLTKEQIKQLLAKNILPYLQSRFTANSTPNPISTTILAQWAEATKTLSNSMSLNTLFPLVDMWRLALLDTTVGTWVSGSPSAPSPLLTFLALSTREGAPRNYTLTLLRLLSNVFATPSLARKALLPETRDPLVRLVITSLLSEDVGIRSVAAGLAFNIAATVQKERNNDNSPEEEDDWQVEVVTAIVEAVEREKGSEDVVHRLTAALALLLYLSPFFEGQLNPLLDALQTKNVLKAKLSKGGCGENGVTKPEVRKLVNEVATVLCP